MPANAAIRGWSVSVEPHGETWASPAQIAMARRRAGIFHVLSGWTGCWAKGSGSEAKYYVVLGNWIANKRLTAFQAACSSATMLSRLVSAGLFIIWRKAYGCPCHQLSAHDG